LSVSRTLLCTMAGGGRTQGEAGRALPYLRGTRANISTYIAGKPKSLLGFFYYLSIGVVVLLYIHALDMTYVFMHWI
jgi:hypothetical protein